MLQTCSSIFETECFCYFWSVQQSPFIYFSECHAMAASSKFLASKESWPSYTTRYKSLLRLSCASYKTKLCPWELHIVLEKWRCPPHSLLSCSCFFSQVCSLLTRKPCVYFCFLVCYCISFFCCSKISILLAHTHTHTYIHENEMIVFFVFFLFFFCLINTCQISEEFGFQHHLRIFKMFIHELFLDKLPVSKQVDLWRK